MSSKSTSYWNEFYRGKSWSYPPSQFSAFVAGEGARSQSSTVLEFGCGDGRDATLLAPFFREYLGIDQSVEAISCSRELGLSNATFEVRNLETGHRASDVGSITGRHKFDVIYARFFLHSIAAKTEDSFLDLARDLLVPLGRLYVAYRTTRDEERTKATAAHFRRYVSPSKFSSKAKLRDFELRYETEGVGFAKFKTDDAHVARQVFTLEAPQ